MFSVKSHSRLLKFVERKMKSKDQTMNEKPFKISKLL